MLIKRKADVNGENFKGESPMHQATRVGNENAISILLKSGARINHQNKFVPAWANGLRPSRTHADLSRCAQTRKGETPLHYAAMLGRDNVVKQLLEYASFVLSLLAFVKIY